jgi:hypothetical protein
MVRMYKSSHVAERADTIAKLHKQSVAGKHRTK